MKTIRSASAALTFAAALALSQFAAGASFVDPLSQPAQISALAGKGLLQGVVRAGARLVAVGQRGHILTSDDGGGTWTQAKVPVSSDLTSVFFVNDKKGWAVGHDGVILHSSDGGNTWSLQFDGRRANDGILAYMQARVAANPASAETKKMQDEAQRFKEQGADKPFLDVWFADENAGWVVGAYNLIFQTKDAGKTWEPWFDQTENPKLMNLYAIAPAAGTLFVAGESGVVMKLDSEAQRFKALPTPYNGSYFGVIGNKDTVLLFGLRGNAYRSDDSGKNWAKVDAGLPATIVSGRVTADGAFLLADAGGRVAVSADGGRTFKPVPMQNPVPITGIAEAGKGRLARVGPRGVAMADLPAR